MREDLKKMLTLSGTIAFLVVLVLYAVYQGRSVLFGSKLFVAKVGSVQTGNVLSLSGIAEHAKQLTIDGRSVPLDSNGSFSESVALQSGVNIITVASVDTFGKTKTQTLSIYHPANLAQTAVNIPPQPGTPQPKTIIN
jgi:hypothetical protein